MHPMVAAFVPRCAAEQRLDANERDDLADLKAVDHPRALAKSAAHAAAVNSRVQQRARGTAVPPLYTASWIIAHSRTGE